MLFYICIYGFHEKRDERFPNIQYKGGLGDDSTIMISYHRSFALEEVLAANNLDFSFCFAFAVLTRDGCFFFCSAVR